MIKELILSTCALSSFSTPVLSSTYSSLEPEQQQTGYVVEEDGMRITYAYETNEVNSSSDLVVGRAYHFDFNNDIDTIFDNEQSYFQFLFFNVNAYDFNDFTVDEFLLSSYVDNGLLSVLLDFGGHDVSISIYLTYNVSNDYVLTYLGDGQTFFKLEGDCIYLGGISQDILNYSVFSKCENIPILSVERIYPTSVMGYVSEFIDDYLLNGIPLIDSVTHQINGTNLTLRSWLNTSICIVIVCLFITLLIIFVRWIFRLFAGLFRF